MKAMNNTMNQLADNPFVGLRPFEMDESLLFFGRNVQVNELIDRLKVFRFLSVIGNSGCGKSSLIRAGLIPKIKGGFLSQDYDRWQIAIMRPGNDILYYLAKSIIAADLSRIDINEETLHQESVAFKQQMIERGSVALLQKIAEVTISTGEQVNFLLLVDQFEEIFNDDWRNSITGNTTGSLENENRLICVNALLKLVSQVNVPVYVVLTMRSDFLGQCNKYFGLPEAMNSGQYLVPRLTRQQLKEAIEGPVRLFGTAITNGLTNRLLNDNETFTVDTTRDELPVLQHALMRTWKYWVRQNTPAAPLVPEDYLNDEVGGMSMALSNHLNELYLQLGNGAGTSNPGKNVQTVLQQLTEVVFRRLTTIDEKGRMTRRPQEFSSLVKIALSVTGASRTEVQTVVDLFRKNGNSFLSPYKGAIYDDTVIDISHESLMRNWGRLKDWMIDEFKAAELYRKLNDRREQHETDPDLLIKGVLLKELKDWNDSGIYNTEWATRYHSAGYDKNSKDAREEYEKNIAYLVKCQKIYEERMAAEQAKKDAALKEQLQHTEEQLRLEKRKTSRIRTVRNLIVFGQKATDTEGSITYTLDTNRSENNRHHIPLERKGSQLEFIFADHTTWICNSETLHELYPEADLTVKLAGQQIVDDTNFELPLEFHASISENGAPGSILLSAVKVFRARDVVMGIQQLASQLENELLVHGIPESSTIRAKGRAQQLLSAGAAMYRLDKNFVFTEYSAQPSAGPILLFIHGTCGDTLTTFGDLKESAAWSAIHEKYSNDVLAFQYRSLTASPLRNAVKLARLLPQNAHIHIISHSTGGLIGEILCKFCSNDSVSPEGFTTYNFDLLLNEGRNADIALIHELETIFSTKKISITKFIRVACPAGGTQLASKKLTHLLNVFRNLQTFPVTIAGLFKEFLSASIITGESIDLLPGIEAQHPQSPFIKLLNDQRAQTATSGRSLAIIAGQRNDSFNGAALPLLIGKLLYLQSSDLVVNTDSMYMGVKRESHIQYFFDKGSDVSHTRYFANQTTRDAIHFALQAKDDAPIPGFTSMVQAGAYGQSGGDDVTGELLPPTGVPSGTKPIVVVLPGLMGSVLSEQNTNNWIDYRGILLGGISGLATDYNAHIAATSTFKIVYGKLTDQLSKTYEVVIYPYDWRKQLSESAAAFNDYMKSLLQLNVPIKIIGHSSGGVLLRDFIIYHDETWRKLNASAGFRAILLGTPLGGSYRILTMLFGNDPIINTLYMLDQAHTKKQLLNVFCQFPGILNLLPLSNDSANDFANVKTWSMMLNATGDVDWPLPKKEQLSVFGAYRDAILAKSNSIDYSNMVYIAGKARQTPIGYIIDNISAAAELVHLYTAEGDSFSTWEQSIPQQMLADGNVYYAPATHGALANEAGFFGAIEELLALGETALLQKSRPLVRAEEKIFRGLPPVNFDLSEKGLVYAVFGFDTQKENVVSRVPLTVTVSNGDLYYARYPLLAGHFINDGILYAEKRIDVIMYGMLAARHKLGIYPGQIGTHNLFNGESGTPFAGAIIVGLGEPGWLTAANLALTTEQAVVYYLLSVKDKVVKRLGISALLIGSGYGGLSVENSMKAIIEGVNRANDKVFALFKNNSKTIQHLEFIELYSSIALSCLYTLHKIAYRENQSYHIEPGSKSIAMLPGSRKRLPLHTGEEWWNRIVVRHSIGLPGSITAPALVFTISASRSSASGNEAEVNTALIDLFMQENVNLDHWSANSAKALFELMVPAQVKEELTRVGNITWIVDRSSAAYPWELLQENMANAKPLCVKAGMIRQLSTSDFRVGLQNVAAEKALIVADPLVEGISQLPGAMAEGRLVEQIIKKMGVPANTLIRKNANDIVQSIFSAGYTIIHLSGHGVFDPEMPDKCGMVIGKGMYLTVRDIQQMAVIPQMVFINCCFVGKTTMEEEAYYADRNKLAAALGTQLIELGVKAVVVAGWVINDNAALDFTNLFYDYMFAGVHFGSAVKITRSIVYDKYPGSNTWGAYQCYGDPFFQLRNPPQSYEMAPPFYIMAEEAEVDLENLLNSLQVAGAVTTDSRARLMQIEVAIEKARISNALILEKQALIYFELGMYRVAVEKFEALLKIENAGFSFASMEKYCSARGKYQIKLYYDEPGLKNKRFIIQMFSIITADMEILVRYGVTVERLHMLGDIYKQQALLLTPASKREITYKTAASCYEEAAKMPNNNRLIYSITNAIELGCIIQLVTGARGKKEYRNDNKTYRLRSNKESKNELMVLKNNLVNTTANYNTVTDTFALLHIDLCLLLVTEKGMGQEGDWVALANAFTSAAKLSGSAGRNVEQREQLQFLAWAFSTEKSSVPVVTTATASGNAEDEAGIAPWVMAVKQAWQQRKLSRTGVKPKTKAVKKVATTRGRKK